jgi:ribonuclease E
VVRTRTDVALYVLNHKRGHLRDLENAFKVTLAIVADPTVAGQQSFIIDRGEQVHTLEAAKALLAAQAAAFPSQVEEAYDDEEPFDIEGEVETEETEGLTEEAAGGEEVAGESEADGHRRKRRRRRRGRGEPREGAAPRDDNDALRVAPESADGAVTVADDGEADDDEGDEQGAVARGEQGPNGERRPRRRGRRGGRRRRGSGPEDGLAGSISDELGPTPVSEVASAVADFDGPSAEPAPTLVEPEPVSQPPQPQWQPAEHASPETVSSAPTPTPEETAQEADRAAARRRSTVREKVSFLTSAPSEPAPAVSHSEAEPAATAPAPAPVEPAPAAASEAAPRKAGWWSRRFGSGE